jgi:hypothetical protein
VFASSEPKLKVVALREILVLLKRSSYKRIPVALIESLDRIHLGEVTASMESAKEEAKRAADKLPKKRKR